MQCSCLTMVHNWTSRSTTVFLLSCGEEFLAEISSLGWQIVFASGQGKIFSSFLQTFLQLKSPYIFSNCFFLVRDPVPFPAPVHPRAPYSHTFTPVIDSPYTGMFQEETRVPRGNLHGHYPVALVLCYFLKRTGFLSIRNSLLFVRWFLVQLCQNFCFICLVQC